MSENIRKINLDNSSLPIREFKMKWMEPNSSICIIAKRGSGKSWLCRDILYHYRYLSGGVIIAPTDRMSKFYGNFIPDSFVHYEYKTSTIENMLARQSAMIDHMKVKFKEGKKFNPRSFIVMDDCLADKKSWAKDPAIAEIFMNGRHYQITYILTMQYPLGISPDLRNNFDYVFLLADDNYDNQRRLHKYYAGVFPTYKAFREVFTQLTENYGCMVLVNCGARKTFNDKVFWYKAKHHKKINIGCRQYKEFHRLNYDPNQEKYSSPFGWNANKLLNNKKDGIKVNIIKDE